MNQQIIINVGVSGSGKTTWTSDFIKNNNDYLRINRDDLRKTLVGDLDGYYERTDLNDIENLINRLEETFITRLFIKGYNIIIDNTHLKKTYIDKILTMIKIGERWEGKKFDIKFKIFDITPYTIDEIKIRVMWRDNFKDLAKVDYIDKQIKQFIEIKKYLENNYKDQII